jgi:hypothetical protein
MDPSPEQGLLRRGGPRHDCGRISGLSVRRYGVPGPDGICALSPQRFLGPEGLYPFQVLKERVVPVVPSCCISPCSYGQESPQLTWILGRTSLRRSLIFVLRRHQGPDDPGILIGHRHAGSIRASPTLQVRDPMASGILLCRRADNYGALRR